MGGISTVDRYHVSSVQCLLADPRAGKMSQGRKVNRDHDDDDDGDDATRYYYRVTLSVQLVSMKSVVACKKKSSHSGI